MQYDQMSMTIYHQLPVLRYKLGVFIPLTCSAILHEITSDNINFCKFLNVHEL